MRAGMKRCRNWSEKRLQIFAVPCLTPVLAASILEICFLFATPMPWVVVDRRRRVARETARFFPAHPVKRVGVSFSSAFQSKPAAGRFSESCAIKFHRSNYIKERIMTTATETYSVPRIND
ncbi:MAG TPA: hypothetical protein VFL34_12415, partial [Candidatus Sulfotelmatobacter sp.]|nr:hypothetical protein [Candidatus Sulfotelmatobacter sp.]